MLLVGATAMAQEPPNPRYLKSLIPAGGRSYLTDAWSVLGFTLTNPNTRDLEARILSFYASDPGRQYGRDIWVPPRATLSSWSCIGPPATVPEKGVVELKSLLYDRTGGKEHLLRSPEGQPLHSDLVRFERGQAGTTVMLDADVTDGSEDSLSARERARTEEVHALVRVFRQHVGLSGYVNMVQERLLPPASEALDGIDHFVLASNRIAEDDTGRQVLRAWLERGGSLWVLLDWVEPETVAGLLGDVLNLQVVDRVSLTHLQIDNGPASSRHAEDPARDVEDPVDFVRVLAPRQQVLYTVNGWPAAFLSEVGRGRVLFTTLGARGWTRRRTAQDPEPTSREAADLPVPLTPLKFLATDLHTPRDRLPLTAADLRSFVTDQVSYTVVGHAAVVWVFGLFFLALTAATLALGRKGLLEHLGWLGPVLALGAAAVLVGLGTHSRGAVPPTVAVAQIVDALPGLDEVQTTGLLAVYQPSPSDSPLGALQGGAFDLDLAGLEGRALRRVQTDLDRWHWENLELPAGIRLAPFRDTIRTQGPVEATVRFGPEGAEGRLAPGPFRQLEDALLSTPGSHAVAVRLGADGSFRVGDEDELYAGQFSASGLLTDRQRARQGLYQKFLAEPQPVSVADRSLLLAWAEPVDMHFLLPPEARIAGAALLAVPLRFERTPPGTRVTIPGAFVDCRRVLGDGRALPPATESHLPATMRLRFRVPPWVLPLVVERARLTLKLHAPARDVLLIADADRDGVPLRRLTSPIGIERVEIDDPRLLRLDEQGTLSMSVTVGEMHGESAQPQPWRIESVGLAIQGRTADVERGEHESR